MARFVDRKTVAAELGITRQARSEQLPDIPAISEQPKPEVTDYGTSNFNSTFNHRLHAFLEDISAGVCIPAMPI